jgi:hypothetical protein
MTKYSSAGIITRKNLIKYGLMHDTTVNWRITLGAWSWFTYLIINKLRAFGP